MLEHDVRLAYDAPRDSQLSTQETRGLSTRWTLALSTEETGFGGDHGQLALGQIAPVDVRRQGVAVGVAFVRGVRGLDTGDLASLQAVAPVDDPAVLVEDDRVQQSVVFDVVGESSEVVLVEFRKEQDGRMELDAVLLVDR